MHLLVTNDDGPPSSQSSPYVLPFVRTLESAGHTVSVCLPHTQRSWIGKAHIVGQDVQATYYWPEDDNSHSGKPWVLVNSTPASCAQLGLYHVFQDRPPIDAVVSGPNYGRNTTALFALSSGTLGAALEAAVCDCKAIALSFAFTDRSNYPEVVAASCRQSVKVIEYLVNKGTWGGGLLYSLNVPVVKDVESKKVEWTRVLQNSWSGGGCFEAMSSTIESPEMEERQLRRQESAQDESASSGSRAEASGNAENWKPRHFKWAPKFSEVYDSVERAGPGSDGWAVKEGWTSVTALNANFMHVGGYEGELKL
ncbi:hypothetical protein LTR50_003449 [Elasticomyces elasticus]|nr:hypothetical protein LTR50_003449 [Elasticomyces elasticus]